jgi:putative transposase
MRTWRRHYEAGGTYFFTVVTARRWPCFTTPWHVRLLGDAFRHTRAAHPFASDAIVVLPDHLHCICTLPPADTDFSLRWQLIKKHFTANLRAADTRLPSRIWQPRFWEHRIRDDADLGRHLDYLHYNPVKHGLAAAPGQWPYSTFIRHVRRGVYGPDWGAAAPPRIAGMDHE